MMTQHALRPRSDADGSTAHMINNVLGTCISIRGTLAAAMCMAPGQVRMLILRFLAQICGSDLCSPQTCSALIASYDRMLPLSRTATASRAHCHACMRCRTSN